MKKVRMIINPSSGRGIFSKSIDLITLEMLNRGYEVSRYYTQRKFDAMEETIRVCKSDYDVIVACGGDGTVNEVANGIGRSKRLVPVAIFSTGTVNDFSKVLNLPDNTKEFVDMIETGYTRDIDMGKSGYSYFVNAMGAGFISSVAHTATTQSKTALGRLAYYIEGIREFGKSGIKARKMKIVSREFSIEDDILMVLVSNVESIGGIKKLSPLAEVEDGLLDVLIIKKSPLNKVIQIMLNLMSGKHVDHANVEYYKTTSVNIETDEEVQVDVDGEFGGYLPTKVEVIPASFRVFSRK